MNVKVVQSSPKGVTTKALIEGSEAPVVAVFVSHGMGQQVPFETISAIAQSIERTGARREGRSENEAHVEMVRDGDEWLPRAELNTTIDGKPVTVHVHEAYWAPFTEGKVTLRDVYFFLKDAGWNALWSRVKDCDNFIRYVFGGLKSFVVPVAPLIAVFTLALLILGSLGLLNSVITVVAAGRVLTGAAPNWPSERLLTDLTVDFILLLACALPLALCYWYVLSAKSKGQRPDPYANVVIEWLIWVNISAILFVALALLIQLVADRNGEGRPLWETWFLNHLLGPRAAKSFSETLTHPVSMGIVWGILIWLSFKVRWFLIQYVGDVAAYISAHKVSKFYELRKAIQKESLRVAKAVYGQDQPRYDKIIFVGHSLGAVVAYDTLNAMIVGDNLNGGPLKVKDRTGSLITFGSPLDKTAFIFRNQKTDDIIREGLAAAVQPLIEDETIRNKIRWINIHSRQDWISGSLEFYDNPCWPLKDPRCVTNIPDPDAATPLMAHTEYWHNDLLGEELLKAIR